MKRLCKDGPIGGRTDAADRQHPAVVSANTCGGICTLVKLWFLIVVLVPVTFGLWAALIAAGGGKL